MNARRLGLLALAACLGVGEAHAQLTPPTLRTIKPLGASPGETIAVEIKGEDLEGASALRFDDPRLKVEGIESGKDAIKAKVTLPAGLPGGSLPFRVVTPRGISNVARLWVGRAIPARPEVEPNNGFAKAQAVPSPSAIEGAIEPGDDVDLYAVEAQAGETLVAEVIAHRAGSGLDALATIFSPEGREVAGDDDRFGRDAAATYLVPRTGRYFVQVQDANGRHNDQKMEQGKAREYRLELGRLPLVTAAFPPGALRGRSTTLRLLGVNLPEGATHPLNVPADAPLGDFRFTLPGANPWPLRAGDGPETIEADAPNDDLDQAQPLAVPSAIHGMFAEGHEPDVDLFRLKAAPGQEGDYVISAYAARVGSPSDPVLVVLDEKGAPAAEDDDKLGRDARLERPIDSTNGIVLAIRERFGRGGPRHAYRIEVERLGGRLAVLADVGSRTLARDGSLSIPLTLDRRGVEGAWTLVAEGLPAGVVAEPVSLPAVAKASAVLVLSANAHAPLTPFALRLAAKPADDRAKGPLPVDLTLLDPPPPFVYMDAGSDPNRPRPPVETKDATLAVAERAPLGLAIESKEITVARGEKVEVKIILDRRTEAAKKPLKVRLLAGEGPLDGFEPIPETAVAADATTATIILKAKPEAAPRRIALTARAWIEGTPEARGISAAPATLIVPEPAK